MLRSIFSLTPLQFASQGVPTTVHDCLRPGCRALSQFPVLFPACWHCQECSGKRGTAPSAHPTPAKSNGQFSAGLAPSFSSAEVQVQGKGYKQEERELQCSGGVSLPGIRGFASIRRGAFKHLRKQHSVWVENLGMSGPLWLGCQEKRNNSPDPPGSCTKIVQTPCPCLFAG